MQFNGLKNTSETADLKTLVAVGGWKAASDEFTKTVSTASSRKHFVNSTLTFLRRHGFDGLDLDWEYPAKRGGVPEDKPNFLLLIKVRVYLCEQ